MKRSNLSFRSLSFAANFKRINFKECIDIASVWMSQHPIEQVHTYVCDAWGNEYNHVFTDIEDFKNLLVKICYADKVNSAGLFEKEIHSHCQVMGDKYNTIDFSVWDLLDADGTSPDLAGKLLHSVWKQEIGQTKNIAVNVKAIAA